MKYRFKTNNLKMKIESKEKLKILKKYKNNLSKQKKIIFIV